MDDAWRNVISKYDLDNKVAKNGFAEITADELNEFRQARLMAKFDHKQSLPAPLAERNWAILAISNSKYAVGPFDLYQKLPIYADPEYVRFLPPRTDLETLNPLEVASEADAILLAHASGILDRFIGESTTLTTFGRMRAESFDFVIRNNKEGSTSLTVDGSQIEIDGGFEGENTFSVIECKNHACSDFNLRQIYYPYRAWSDRISKIVYPIFMIFNDGIFHLFKYEFEYPDDINSGQVIQYAAYTTVDAEITLSSLFNFAKKEKLEYISGGTLPQADDFQKIIALVEKCLEAPQSKVEIADMFNFELRQADYYVSAGRYLGFLEEEAGLVFSTSIGEMAASANGNDKVRLFAQRLLSWEPVSRTFLDGNSHTRGNFSSNFALDVLRESPEGAGLGEETLQRRARTVVNWCKWLDEQAKY